MDEYISKEIAIEKIKRVKPHVVMSEYGVGYERGLKDAIGILNATPAADVQPVSQWISVEDKLPIEQGPVLCYARSTTGEGNCRILGTLRIEEFWFLQVDGTQLSFPCLHLKVTHWMPLPEPPKDGDAE